jgi:hypothetical protein
MQFNKDLQKLVTLLSASLETKSNFDSVISLGEKTAKEFRHFLIIAFKFKKVGL